MIACVTVSTVLYMKLLFSPLSSGNQMPWNQLTPCH